MPLVDVHAISTERWWTVGESHDNVCLRMAELLHQLYTRASQPGATIFVGHSQVLRQLFRNFCNPEVAQTAEGDLQSQTLANCAVLRVQLTKQTPGDPESK